MGNKFISLVFLFYGTLFASQESFSDIDVLVQRVKIKRVGLSHTQIQQLKNPFIHEKTLQKIVKKEKNSKKKRTLQLVMIINNRAKIGERWYNLYDKIGSFKIVKIDPWRGIVVLSNQKKRKILSLEKKSKKAITIISQ